MAAISSNTATSSQRQPTSVHAMWELAVILIVGVLLAARIFATPPLLSANDRSRWCTVWSLVERGTYTIDEIRTVPGWDTIDLVRHDGHFYSSKPPFLSTLVAGTYAVLRSTTPLNLNSQTALTTQILVFVWHGLPFLGLLVLWRNYLRRHLERPELRALPLLVGAFGTLLLPFATSLNNHLPAAVAAMATIDLLDRIRSRQRSGAWQYALCGFAAAFCCCCELPAVVLGLIAFGFCFQKHHVRTWAGFVPAALVPLGFYFVTNIIVTGGVVPFYAYYGTEKYVFTHEGIPSYWSEPGGIDRATDSVGVYLFHCLLGHHGVFSLTPVWLFAVIGTGVGAQRSWPRLQFISRLTVILSLWVFAFYLTRTENYNYGGMTVALRWTLWLVPFWLTGLIPIMELIYARRGLWIGAWAAVCLSVFSAWYPFVNPWQSPWLFRVLQSAGMVSLADPPPVLPQTGYTWLMALPDSPARDNDYWIEFAQLPAHDGAATIRLSDAGPRLVQAEACRGIDVTTVTAAGETRVQTYWIAVVPFRAGERPKQFLRWPAGLPAAAEQLAAYEFWQGLPLFKQYVPSRKRYLKTPLRTDAFSCVRAAITVGYEAPVFKGPAQQRCDVWACEEVPYGVAQRRVTVTESGSGEYFSVETWTLSGLPQRFLRSAEE